MCGRYAFFAPVDAVRRWFGVEAAPDLEARYNISPTQDVPVVRETAGRPREIVLLRWGLVPRWATDPSVGQRMINARAETLAERPAWRDSLRQRRCLVVASGWYEWQPTAAGKQPWFIFAGSGEPLAFAGLWERWRDPAGSEALESCAIVTRPAAPAIAALHERMPALLSPEDYAAWLDPAAEDTARLAELVTRSGGIPLTARPVSRAVNDARREGPELVAPVPTGAA